MKYLLFSIYDSKAKLYMPPFFMRSVPEAVRSVKQLANEKGHSFNYNAEDYTLMQIGEWYEQEGKLIGMKANISLCGLLELRDVSDMHPLPETAVNGKLNLEDAIEIAKAQTGTQK